MREDLFPNLERTLSPQQADGCQPQSFEAYRRSRPARQSAQRRAIYVCRVGELSPAQEAIVAATAEYLGVFFDLPVRRGADFDPGSFPAWGIREHAVRRHPQLLTSCLINEVLWLDRPEEALICLAVTNWDLCSDDFPGGQWGSSFGEALYGHAGVWSLRYLGDPGEIGSPAFRRCLKRSCAVASHEALHVLGLDHCTLMACNMKGCACLTGPLNLCPSCLRKLAWNRQLDLLPYFERLHACVARWDFTEAVQRCQTMVELLRAGVT